MEQFKHIEGALELRCGTQNIYVKCKNLNILNILTTEGANGEILVVPKVYGKQCINVIVFDVPLEVGMQELTEYNPLIVHARRMTQRGIPTQRVIITYEGATAPKKLKVVQGLSALRCAVFHPLTPFCTYCSKWGHSYRGCPREAPRCMYCALPHLSKECAEKIAQKQVVPKKCVNCRCDHNANSPLCMYYPKDRKNKNAAYKPPTESLITAPVPEITNEKEFPSLPRRTVPKPRRDHAPRGKGAPSGSAPAPKKHQEAQVPVGKGAAASCSGQKEEVPRDPGSLVAPHETHTRGKDTDPLPPAIPPDPGTVGEATPAASPAVLAAKEMKEDMTEMKEDMTEIKEDMKEILQSIKEMVTQQTIMLQTVLALVQQMAHQQHQRPELILTEEANGANI